MKKSLSLGLAAAIAMSSFGATAASFTDITDDVRTEAAADRLSDLGILEGFEDGTFRPEENLTREQFAAAIVRTLGFGSMADLVKGQETGFNDVAANRWSSGYIKIASNEEVINGVGYDMFAPERPVHYQEAVTMMVRALGLETEGMEYPTDYLKIAEDKGLLANLEGQPAEAASRALLARLLDNALEEFNYEKELTEAEEAVVAAEAAAEAAVVVAEESKLQADVDAAQALVSALTYESEKTALQTRLDAIVVTAEDLEVESVSAINATTLGVTFNKELTADEKADAVFALKRANNSLQTAAVVWDGAVAQIQRADKAVLTAGDYEVTVTGVTDEALVGTATVEARKATSIEITSDRANPAASQSLGYVVNDQYGDDMNVAAANLTTTAFNTTDNTNRPVTGTINNMDFSSTNVGDVVKVTAYVTSDPTIKVVKDITVSNISLGSVALGEAELPTGVTRLETTTAGVVIPVTAKDNFGKDMKLTAGAWTSGTATAEGLIPTFTGASFSSVAVNADGNLVVTLGTPGTAKLTITNPATGDVVVKELTVVAAADTAAITLSQPEGTIRMGTNVNIPFELKDQFGEEFTVASPGWATGDVSLTSSNTAVATVGWAGNNIQVVPVSAGTTTIFANVTTPFSTGSATLTITVEAAPEASAISVNGTPTTNLATGQTVANTDDNALSFKIVDQDGDPINLAATTASGVKANLTITDANSVLTAPTAGVLMAADMTGDVGVIDAMTVTADNTNTGTATVKVQLFDDANGNDTMDAGEELNAEVSVVYTVAASQVDKGQFTNITGTINADGTAAYAAEGAAQTLTYSLQDQAGNAITTTAANNVTWTVKNTGTTAVTVNDGTAKTLAAGATGTYTTVAAAGASANATLIVNSADAKKVEVTAAAQGVATPAKTDIYFTDLTVVNTDTATYTGTVVAFDKAADWAVISTSVGNVVLTDYNATATYTVDGNTALVPAFENALTIGDTLKVTADGTNAVYALTNN